MKLHHRLTRLGAITAIAMALLAFAAAPAAGQTTQTADLVGLAHSAAVHRGDDAVIISYHYVVRNFSDEAVQSVQIYEDLAATFGDVDIVVSELDSDPQCPVADDLAPAAGGMVLAVLAPGCELGPGEEISSSLELSLPPSSDGVYFSSAVVVAHTTGGIEVTDLSSAGSRPDANNNNDPSDDTTPTVVDLTGAPAADLLGASVVRDSEEAFGEFGPSAAAPQRRAVIRTVALSALGLLALMAAVGAWQIRLDRQRS